MLRRIWVTLLIVCSLASCSTKPPEFIASGSHPLLYKKTSLIVDACILYDTLSRSDDQFLLAESLATARRDRRTRTDRHA